MPPKPELMSDQRTQVVSQLLLLVKDGSQPPKLKRGALTSLANNFDVKPKTVRKMWVSARQNYEDPFNHPFLLYDECKMATTKIVY
jgi:hypothetical protein